MQKKTRILILLLVLLVCALVSCSAPQEERNIEEFPFVQLGEKEGEFTELAQNYPEVIMVRGVLDLYFANTENFDYEVEPTVPLSGLAKEKVEAFQQAEMVNELIYSEVVRIVFNNDFTEAEALVKFEAICLDGKEEELAKLGRNLGGNVYENKITLVKDYADWKIAVDDGAKVMESVPETNEAVGQ